MTFFNYDAKAVVRDGEYQLSQYDLELIEINSIAWEDKSKPPFEICRYVVEMIEIRLGEVLDEGSRKRLAASVLNMNYFQFSDYLFKANSETKRSLNKSGERKSLKNIFNNDMEKHRQEQEIKLGKPVSPQAHKISYKANYSAIRKEKLNQSIDPKRLKEVRKAIQNYENQAIDCLSLVTSQTLEPLAIGSSKLGGNADMLEKEKYPVGKDGKDMILLAQINIADAHLLLPDFIPKNKGLLSFFAADEELAGQRDHEIAIRYYADISLLHKTVNPKSTSFHELAIELKTNKSLPINPWPLFEKFERDLGSEMEFYFEFVQGKLSTRFSSLFGYSSNVEMRPLMQNGQDVSDQIGNFVPLLKLKSQYDKDVEKPMMFGDGGEIGYFIEPKDWKNWDFTNVAFTTFN